MSSAPHLAGADAQSVEAQIADSPAIGENLQTEARGITRNLTGFDDALKALADRILDEEMHGFDGHFARAAMLSEMGSLAIYYRMSGTESDLAKLEPQGRTIARHYAEWREVG